VKPFGTFDNLIKDPRGVDDLRGSAVFIGAGHAAGHAQGLSGSATGHNPMLSRLKAAWSRLVGGAGAYDTSAIAAVEYKGYRIRPTPYRSNGQYQTAGTIEKQTPEGVKEHRFVRADTYHSRDDAIAFTVSKAKQIIDQQGDRIFA
jgi:hypothetical protein